LSWYQIYSSATCSHTPSFMFSFMARGLASHPYRTTDIHYPIAIHPSSFTTPVKVPILFKRHRGYCKNSNFFLRILYSGRSTRPVVVCGYLLLRFGGKRLLHLQSRRSHLILVLVVLHNINIKDCICNIIIWICCGIFAQGRIVKPGETAVVRQWFSSYHVVTPTDLIAKTE
jgi:hypothetical protein